MITMIRVLILLCLLPLAVIGQETILTGRVWDPIGEQPVSNAEIKLYLGQTQGELTARTDDSGQFVFTYSSTPFDLDYAIIISKEDYYLLNGSVRLNYGEAPERLFNIYRKEQPKAPEVRLDQGPSLLGAPVNNLIFLIDVSGSMAEQNRLDNLKESLSFLVGLYRPEDRISIITYSSEVQILLEGGRISEINQINRIIGDLLPTGKTEGVAGLLRAYDLAEKNYLQKGNNKVILATDGIFGEDKKSRKLVEDVIIRGRSQDVRLSILSFGDEAESIAERLQAWSRAGGGHHTHIHTLEEAKDQIFREARGE
jgi:Mg-chelatase subunit ChlD